MRRGQRLCRLRAHSVTDLQKPHWQLGLMLKTKRGANDTQNPDCDPVSPDSDLGHSLTLRSSTE